MRASPLPLALLAVLPLGLGGCLYFKGEAPTRVQTVFKEFAWSPAAEALSVHPATRQTIRGKRFMLDVRVRLIDALGDYTKASGQWRFELHAVEGRATENNFTLLGLWNEPIMSLAQHQAHFDLTTRAYRFELPLAHPLHTEKPTKLLVVFTPDGGSRMAAEFELKPQP